MKSIDYPEANFALAKDQPEYQTLYVHVAKTPERQMISCYELTEEEVAAIVKNKKLWYSQLTFGTNYQPMSILVDNPFVDPVEAPGPPMDENRTTGEVWDKTHFAGTEGTIFPGQGYVIHGKCKNCGKEESQHFWSSRQCQL